MSEIDITFNMFSDTPAGKDPDSFSPTLRKYHQILWSKPLPNGKLFHLDLDTPRLLHHKSELGEFFLSSDAIGHTYKGIKKMQHITEKISSAELNAFFALCTTIAGYIVFPSKRIENKMTINGARGVNHRIQDRFDLTLECIRRFYIGEYSPLSEVFERYSEFFNLFTDFEGYTDFFLLQDLVKKDYSQIKFWHPFDDFDGSPLPRDMDQYQAYKQKVTEFIKARNARISEYLN